MAQSIAEEIEMFHNRMFISNLQIQTSVVKLLELFSLKYWNDPTVTIPGEALSCILRNEKQNDLKKIRSLNYPVNQSKIYQQNSTLFKVCIDIESLDITLIHELLTKVTKFPTHKTQLRALKQQLNLCKKNSAPKLLCCLDCSHICLSCSKEECDRTCPNPGWDHCCQHCTVNKSQCIKANCVQCQSKPPEEQCGFLIVCVDSLDLFHKNRNNISHMTPEDCKQFIEKRKQLSGFPQCSTPENIFHSILSSYKRIVDLLTNQKLFNFNGASPISFLNRRNLLHQMNNIFFNNEINVSQQFAQSIIKQSFFVTEENKTLREKVEASERERLYNKSEFCLEEYHEDECVLSSDIKVVGVVEIRVFQSHNEQKIEQVEVHDHHFHYDTTENIFVITIKHTIKEGCKYKYEAVVEDADNKKWNCHKDGLDPFDINYVEFKNITTNNKLIKVACNKRKNSDIQISITEKISRGFKASFNALQNDSIVAVEYKKHRCLSFAKLDVQTTCQRKEKNYLLECILPSSGIYDFRVLIRSQSDIYRFLTLNGIEIFDHLEHTSSCSQTMLMFHPYGECNDVHRELEFLPRLKAIVKVSIKPSAGGVAKRDIDDLDNYVEQNFRNQNVFSFPPLYMTSRDTSYFQIVDRFESYYRNYQNAKAIILSGADLRDNLLTLGYTDEDVTKLCNDTIGTGNVFVFDSKRNTVFVINICKEEEANAETLKDHHRLCNNDARLFLTINQHIIGTRPMAIVGIVACLNGSKEDVKCIIGCKDCFQQTLTKDDLQSTELFSRWFGQLNVEVKKYFNSHLGISESNDFVFKLVSNRLLLLSAIKNFSLPATSVGTDEEKLSRLVLNYPQIHAVYDKKSSKKVIKGGYGSGKTLILKKALEILVTAGIPTIVYYILFDPYSMVNMEIFKYVSTIPNSNSEKVCLKNVYQLSIQAKARNVFTLLECLKYIRNLHPKETTHVLVDEYDEEELTQIQALQIKGLLSSSENFKDATVVISVQSVEKHSTKFDSNEAPIRGNTIDWKTTGMKLYKLPHTMRSTNNISDLVETFQEGVATTKNVIHLPVESTEQPSLMEESLKEFSGNRIAQSNDSANRIAQSNVSANRIAQSNVSANRIAQSNDSANKFPVRTTSTGDMTSSTHSDILQPEATIDTLAASSLIPSHHLSRIQRAFTFISSIPGHKIIGTRPKLLRLENCSYIDVSIVQYYIENYCFNEDHLNKALFICNNISLMNSFIEVFKYLHLDIFEYCDSILNNRPPSFEKQNNTYEKLMNAKENNLLVLTDIRGCRGLEYRKVICVVDESNKYERHMLVEGLSRATSHLYILSIQDESNETNISKIIDDLVEKKYVDNVTRHCKDGTADIEDREKVQIKMFKKQDKSNMLKRKYEAISTESDLTEEDITRNWSFEDLDVLIEDQNFTKVINLITIIPSIIQLSGDIEEYDGNNNLLHSATRHDSDVDFVQHLINAGCSMKEKNSYGEMPIHWAAMNNHVGIVKMMLDNDPSLINERNDHNMTSLHHAAIYNHKEVVRVLLNHPDIDVNIKDYNGLMADEYGTNDEIKRMIQQHRENNSL